MMALLGVLALRQGLAANENLRLVARLRRLAYADQLTGLPNRLLFNRRLRQALRDGHAGRRAAARPGRLQAGQRPVRARQPVTRC